MRRWTKTVTGEILFITTKVLLGRVKTELVTCRRAWPPFPGDSRVHLGGCEVGAGRVRIIEVPEGNIFILVLGPTTLTPVSKWADFCVTSGPFRPPSLLPRPHQEPQGGIQPAREHLPQGPPARRPGLL